MTAKHRFSLYLPGLLKVLAEHLYSSKKVGVRELLQNAHDSCVRRKIEEGNPHYRPRIDLAVNPRRRTLTIRDNGCGLTADEIGNYLATIGKGYTGELRERLAFSSPDEASELIGQFGLGFLSAFLLAGEVTVVTRSYQGGPALRWHCSGDEHYEMGPAEGEVEIGTTVELLVKPAAAFVLQEQHLVETVRTYADLLPTPIYLDGDPQPLNVMTPPWEADDLEAAARAYAARASGGTEPLFVLPLRDGKVNLGHDTITVPLQGFLYVPTGSVVSVREYGDLTVYIRRMFICDRERDLLPPWARFVRGVIDCPVLQPTASREGLHQDDRFESVRQTLEDQLGRGLRDLARRDPERWKRLVQGHADLVVSWAVKDNEFFERVRDIVPFRTSRGPLTLPEYLKLSGGTFYYVTREMGSLQDQLLAEGRDVPAIDASWFAVTPFLGKYAARRRDIALVQLDGEAETLLRPAAEEPFANLIAYYRGRGVRAKVASFRPVGMPVLMLYPQGAETVREAGSALEAGGVPEGLAGLVGAYVDQRTSGPEDHRGTLYLNASCPLVRRLAEAAPDGERLVAVLTVLWQNARLFCGRTLTAADAARAFRELTQAIERLLQP
ncbi:MAG: ATP-binding protein [Gemmataceae bacterium]|nr:ATP-binding protein [Gemmataceae bacterium]